MRCGTVLIVVVGASTVPAQDHVSVGILAQSFIGSGGSTVPATGLVSVGRSAQSLVNKVIFHRHISVESYQFGGSTVPAIGLGGFSGSSTMLVTGSGGFSGSVGLGSKALPSRV